VDRVRQEQELVATAWPDVAERVDDAVGTAASVLAALEPLAAEPVLCHGDFTPGQLVRVPGGLALLDLDTVALGDPASDLGRFLAYEAVRAARVERSPAPVAAARAAFLAAYGAPPGGAEPTRLLARLWAYQRLNLAVIALRATRRFKGARSALALTLLDTSDPIPGRLP
jgi:aminoglycoside phosphotransferase (APT) family kinase protein